MFVCLMFSGEESDGQEDILKRSTERQTSVGSETEFPLNLDFVAEESSEQSPTVNVVD